MTTTKRLLFGSATLVLILLLLHLATSLFFGPQSKEQPASEFREGNLVFQFSVYPNQWDYGGPQLQLKVLSSTGEVIQGLWILGSATDWFPTESIDLRVIRYEEISTVVLSNNLSKPLVIWEADKNEFAPKRLRPPRESIVWRTEALRRIARALGEDVCLGEPTMAEIHCSGLENRQALLPDEGREAHPLPTFP